MRDGHLWQCALAGRSGRQSLPVAWPVRRYRNGPDHNFHRHYDPVLADYTAPDPIGLAGGYHFYAYPRNPLRWDDPFGLECVKDEEGNPIPKDDPDHPKDGTGAPAVATEPEPPPPGVPEDEAKPPGQMSDEELRAGDQR